MKNLLQELKERVLFCDGAMGTMLQKVGFKSEDCPEEWNITNRDKIKSIYRAYIEAGCDIIITNTFGANKIKLKKFNLENRTNEFNLAAVNLAREIAGEKNFVFGDVGPIGELLEPFGDLTIKELEEAFAEQIESLVNGGVDAIVFETMSSIEEITAGVKISKKIAAGIPVIASMTFEKGNQGYKTMMGVDIKTAVEKLEDAGADVIGTNCGKGVNETIEIIKEMKRLTNVFLIAEPNAGLPKLINNRVIYDTTPEIFGGQAKELVKTGANIIGGCCGTTPEHIREIIGKVKI